MPSDMQVLNDEGETVVNFRFDTTAPSINIFDEIEPFMERVYDNAEYSDMSIGTNVSDIMDGDLWACLLPSYEHLVAWACFFNASNIDNEVVLCNVDMGELYEAEVGLWVILDVKKRLSENIVFI